MDTRSAPEPPHDGSHDDRADVGPGAGRDPDDRRSAPSVFEAWTDAELFRQWWVPKSLGITLLSCEIDARVGGGYRLTFDNGTAEPMAFFGRYLEVTPPTRLVWTNEEGDDGTVVTTVDVRGPRRRDPAGRPRPLSVEGGAGRGGRVRGDELEPRDVRSAGRAARQAAARARVG